MPVIMISENEPPHVKKNLLKKFPQAIEQHLSAGDIKIFTDDNDIILIERKNLNDTEDLLKSIVEGRLFDQAHRMRQETRFCFVVPIGIPSTTLDGFIQTKTRTTEWTLARLNGALATVQQLGATLWPYVLDEETFPDVVEQIIKHGRDCVWMGDIKREAKVLSPGQAMLTAFPGIGYKRLQKLLEFRPKPIDALLELLDNHRQTVPGITTEMKTEIRNYLEVEEGELVSKNKITSSLDYDFLTDQTEKERERILT